MKPLGSLGESMCVRDEPTGPLLTPQLSDMGRYRLTPVALGGGEMGDVLTAPMRMAPNSTTARASKWGTYKFEGKGLVMACPYSVVSQLLPVDQLKNGRNCSRS